MPGPNFGYSFSPTNENAMQSRGDRGQPASGGQGGAGTIQTLNFKMPSIAGSPHNPSPLSTDTQVGSSFGGAVLQSVLRTVLGADQAASVMNAAPQGGGGGDQGQSILQMLGGGGPSQLPSHGLPMPASPAPQTTDGQMGPVDTGNVDPPAATMPNFSGSTPEIPLWAQYGGGTGFGNWGYMAPPPSSPPRPAAQWTDNSTPQQDHG